ncbi:hypothetical protein V7075_26420 [Neobacillus drentensis]|uniref:hypothetical protein n=1 Tax=Neobacillus drentensis TaxID=220684 RepID=UPI002FFF4B70
MNERMGFPAGYDQRFDIPIDSKMFIYVTEYQRIMAVNQVIGKWEERRNKYSPTGKFPHSFLLIPLLKQIMGWD